jgi:hypothetical protein
MSETKAKKSWMDLFIKPTEVDEKSETKTEEPANNDVVLKSIQQNTTVASVVNTSTVDPNLIAQMEQVFTESNFEGLDMFEFIATLKNYENLPLAENTKYETAFATLSGLGLTKARILETAEQYKVIFEKCKAEFITDMDNEVKTSVEALNNEAETLAQDNMKKIEDINRLNQEIQANQEKIGKLKGDAVVNSNTLSNKKSTFENSYTVFINKISYHTENVNKYIK